MKDGMLDFEDDRAFILSDLEVYNWGPFSNKHRATFDPEGTAIIGATGSGKTTLVDALMTLLAETPRYNLASTGGHDKNDRSLMSYVRGHGGGPGGDLVSRPGKTVTGLAASYQNTQTTIRIGAILWVDSSSGSQQDLKRRFFFAEDASQTLDLLLRQWEQEGARQLMKHGRETPGLRIFESKKAYLAHLRKFFDVGENAFNLLNRAAGLKQLDSVDSIFRELVLDDKSAFNRAVEVAGDFDNLSAIHKELEDARRQRDSLLPIEKEAQRHEKLTTNLAAKRQVKSLTARWYAQLRVRFHKSELKRLEEQVTATATEKEQQERELESAVQRADDLQQRYLKLGGGNIQQIQQIIDTQKQLLEARGKQAAHYQAVARAFDLSTDLSAPVFQQNQARLAAEQPKIQTILDQLHEEEAEARSQLRDAKKRSQELEQTIREAEANSRSNIPPKYQRFRHDLAQHLNLSDRELPFVAELIEVKPSESAWRGAIERAIGTNRLRILVPDTNLRDALRWVNQRDNQLHVRLQKANLNDYAENYFSDSFIYKLNFADHPLRPAVENLLARQDYHCVPDTEALRHTAHGLTKEGTMSGSSGRFDKQDQRRLSEGWLTGFDNRDQLRFLAGELTEARKTHDLFAPRTQQLSKSLREKESELRLLVQISELTFEQVDTPSVQRLIDSEEEKLARLLAPDSEASQAKADYDRAQGETTRLRDQVGKIGNALAVIDNNIENTQRDLASAEDHSGPPFTSEETALGNKHLPIPSTVTRRSIEDTERQTLRDLDLSIENFTNQLLTLEKRLVSLMEKARGLNEGAYTDVGTDLADIPFFLTQLQKLLDEALPEKQQRFLAYLNKSSDQGVTQLLAHIEQEVAEIENRLAELNVTLAKVDFRTGHFLQLQPQRLSDVRIRNLESAQRKLRSAMLADDGGQSHFRALQNIVTILRDAGNNRHQVGSRALLDPRYRLKFFVVEKNRETGATSSGKSGSQSGSGGEKELMASHILTASLSYALCPTGASRPLYGTIVLDEAFSKSSQSAARLIVRALRVFGLFPVFVTPNKEISLLKKHTRRAICVQRNPDVSGSSLATITWQELAQLNPHSKE